MSRPAAGVAAVPAGIEVGLTAAIVAVEGVTPLILVVEEGRDAQDSLPFGPFDPVNHRTLEMGLRGWVEAQTRLKLGYVEQLYTNADRTRDPHLGACLAVLVGDLGNAFAIELLCRSAVASAHGASALEVFWAMQRDVVYGQGLDLIAYPDVALIQRLKTGSYSVKGPLLLGAVMAGASAKQKSALERYAEPAGLAFQVRDDLLGVFGAPELTGKPAGNDLRNGKRTLLIEELEARVPEPERGPLAAVFGDAQASDAKVADAIALIEQCGAKAAVEARIRELASSAQHALDDADLSDTGRGLLVGLVQLFAQRDH